MVNFLSVKYNKSNGIEKTNKRKQQLLTGWIKNWVYLWVNGSHVFLIKDELKNTILIEKATHASPEPAQSYIFSLITF